MAAQSRLFDAKPKTEDENVGIDKRTTSEVALGLRDILTKTYALTVKTHVHHWNVVGPLFYQLHLLLEVQYQELFQAADTLAERMRALGVPAAFPEIRAKPEVETMSVEDLLADLITDNQALCRVMRDLAIKAEQKKDIVTHDLLVARLAAQEKAIWMLKATVAE